MLSIVLGWAGVALSARSTKRGLPDKIKASAPGMAQPFPAACMTGAAIVDTGQPHGVQASGLKAALPKEA